jgi:hypothetical protein
MEYNLILSHSYTHCTSWTTVDRSGARYLRYPCAYDEESSLLDCIEEVLLVGAR